MHSTTNFHVNGSTRVNGEILVVPGSGRVMFFTVEGADRMDRMTFIVNDPVFLDKLANEAERLCREFVGDVPEPAFPHEVIRVAEEVAR